MVSYLRVVVAVALKVLMDWPNCHINKKGGINQS